MTTLGHDAHADLLEAFTALAIQAAGAILRQAGDRAARIKADGSPVTAADQAAEAVILEGLARAAPRLPIVSEEHFEESASAPAGDCIILVDPLDGTRDFVAGRDEYTVNIALLTDGKPVLGVIAAPALGQLWRGIVGRGAERLDVGADGGMASCKPIHTRRRSAGELVVVVSRSHLDPTTRAHVDALPHVQLLPSGSSLKFCRIAEGAADHYPRLAPTRDWDVAAGHAILEAAGGRVTVPDGGRILYGSKTRTIPAFLAWGD